MSGIELARHFARIYPSVPILLISGRMDLTYLEQERWQHNPIQILAKPFRLNHLREKVAEVIRSRV